MYEVGRMRGADDEDEQVNNKDLIGALSRLRQKRCVLSVCNIREQITVY